MDRNLYQRIYDALCKMPVIDTHEHLSWDEADFHSQKKDVLSEYLTHYLSSDIISAGMKREDFEKAVTPDLDLLERWDLLEPYWEASRYTGYGRAIDIAVKDIYGVEGVHRHTLRQLNERFLANRKVGHYEKVLGELCNIETSIVDVYTFLPETKNPRLKWAWQPEAFLKPHMEMEAGIFQRIEGRYRLQINTLDDWLEALERELDWVLRTFEIRILKSAIAYSRSLDFQETPYSVAKEQFAKVLLEWRSGTYNGFPKELQDYMMHAVLRLANARNLTFQFHTGLLEGNGNILSNSDPSLLNPLFIQYPDVDFDLFHISYPYQGVACALAKMFPNVTIDMCWAHIISPSACVSALHDFLDTVPYTKISAFGGDYLFPDGVYGHLTLSRMNIARVLTEKIEAHVFTEEKAVEIGKALYYSNPKRIFKL